MASQPIADHLLKSTGKYSVSFEDIHWINNNLCPDPNFDNKSSIDFSPDNPKHCHELMIRVYYPTTVKINAGSPYYRPIVISEQKILKAKNFIKIEDIEKLAQLKSHTIEKAPIVKNKQFPVVLFISGLGGQVQLYENTITQIVSHGFIVVGINSIFIHGDVALPNNKIVSIVEPSNWDTVAKKTIPILEQDIAFVYQNIHKTTENSVFKAMDLKHIGALGHSFGGRAIANVTNQHRNWFQALVTFDMEVHMGSFKPNHTMLPTMHVISAYWRSMFNSEKLFYSLNKNGYLITLSPTADDKHYSYHMNFTDFSILQYLPAYQASMAYERSRLATGEEVIIKNRNEKVDKLNNINRPFYSIKKNKNTWDVFYKEPGKKSTKISLETIPNLQLALNNLPLIQIKQSELNPIKKIIHAYHQGFGNYLGKGDGLKITKAINLYVVDFFDIFLKNKENIFKSCKPLTSNTYMQCGPGIF